MIEKLGSAVDGLQRRPARDRRRHHAQRLQQRLPLRLPRQDGAGTQHGFKAIGGWQFGNTIDGCQAEYVLVPDAMANLAPMPDGLTDEQVLMCPDIMSTGFSGAESGGHSDRRHRGGVRAGADRPVRHRRRPAVGATTIIGVDAVAERLAMARRLGADHCVDFKKTDPGGGDHAADRRSRRRCRHRGARHPGDLRSGPARAAPGRHAVQPGRLFERPHDSARALRGRPRRHDDRHDALPGRQGAHAPADVDDRRAAAST